MDFEKKNNTYKIIMAVCLSAFVTFLLTLFGTYNYCVTNGIAGENLTISDSTKSLEYRIESLKSYISDYYLGDINEEELIESALKGYVSGLGDRYTEYLTKQDYDELMVDVNGSYSGVGIYISENQDGDVVILSPIKGSPAEEAELKSNDIILKIDGEECKGKDITIVSNNIKGPEGTTVDLEILREGEIFTKTIERRKVNINYVDSEVLEKNIGYIQLMSFDGNASAEFEKQYKELKDKGIKSLIIDIRDNGGGLVSEVLKIADLIAPKDTVLMRTLDKDKNEDISKAKYDRLIDIDIVLLVNGNSASASEILAGALKDNNLAKIVGTKTFGKGVMQEIVPVKSGGAIKVTIQEFKTPNNDTIHKVGIEPDYVVENSGDKTKDEQLQKAIELLK